MDHALVSLARKPGTNLKALAVILEVKLMSSLRVVDKLEFHGLILL